MRRILYVAIAWSALSLPLHAAPSVAPDLAQIADTFGLRTGMTLAEARSKIAALGGEVQDLNQSPRMHSGFVRGPNPAYFVRSVGIGTAASFMNPIDSSRTAIYLSVFPTDLRADYRDDKNLVIYYLSVKFEFKVMFNSGGTMPVAEFRDAANKRYGPFKTSRSSGACGAEAMIFIGAERAASFKSVGGDTQADKTPQTVIEARKCSRFESLDTFESKGQVTGGAIIRYDFALAEQAYINLTQVVGHDPSLEALAAKQQADKAARAASSKP